MGADQQFITGADTMGKLCCYIGGEWSVANLLKIYCGACRNDVAPVPIVIWVFRKILEFYSFLLHFKLKNLAFT